MAAGEEDDSTWVAVRFDKTHVVFLVGDESTDFALDEAHTKKLRSLGQTSADYGPGTLWEPDDELLAAQRKLFDLAHSGETWQLQVTANSQIPVVVQKGVVAEAGCSDQVGFLAEVDPSHQSDFDSAPSPYFLISGTPGTALQSMDPRVPRLGRLPDWKSTPKMRSQIAHLLQTKMEDEIAKVSAQSAPEYERAISSDSDWKSWAEKWKDFDERLARGEGKLEYNVQAFQLAPDGVPRLYARAKWMLGRQSAFLMSAWLRAGSPATIESWDAGASGTMRIRESSNADLGIEALGVVLNVFDRVHDGHGELLIYSPGYEGYDLHLFRYEESGPVRRAVSLSGGC